MSYILQALKKSQQDRELGRVPTLSTSADGTAPMPTRSINPWSFGALILALTAVLIALYGTFGDRLHHTGDRTPPYPGSSLSLESDSKPRTIGTDEPGSKVASKPVTPPSLLRSHPGLESPARTTGRRPVDPPLAKGIDGLPPGSSDPSPGKPGRPDRPDGPKEHKIAPNMKAPAQNVAATLSTEQTVRSGGVSPTSPPRPSPPAERDRPRLPDTAMTEEPSPAGRPGVETPPVNPADHQDYSKFLRAEARRLRERLARLDSAPALIPLKAKERPTPPETVVVPPPAPPAPAPERSAPSVQRLGKIEFPTPSRPSAGDRTASETTDRRPRPPLEQQLPREVHRALPDRQIIAHIYAKEPERRFIIVNSTKLREGEQTTDGLILHEVRPDGIVFRFRDHQFFQPR